MILVSVFHDTVCVAISVFIDVLLQIIDTATGEVSLAKDQAECTI